MKINKIKKIFLMVACLGMSGASFAFDVNEIVRGFNNVKDGVNQMQTKLDEAKQNIELAKTILDKKNTATPAKEKAFIAAYVLTDGLEVIYQLIDLFAIIDDALIKADIPQVSDLVKNKIAPEVKSISDKSKQVKSVSNVLRSLIPAPKKPTTDLGKEAKENPPVTKSAAAPKK